MQNSVDLTVLIPCYNEAEGIVDIIKRVPNMPWTTEILVVDAGSSDNTGAVARSIKRKGLRVIGYKETRTKGYACAFGIENAKGRVTVIQDADMDPESIPVIVRPIFEGTADFVNGTRMILPMEQGSMTRLNRFGNTIFAMLVSAVIGKHLTDSLCGYKAFHTDLLRGKLVEDNWPDFEMIIKAKRLGAKIIEVPIRYNARKTGQTKMQPLSHGWSMLKMLAKLTCRR